MQKPKNNPTSKAIYRRVQSSTTLNRKYVNKPVPRNGVIRKDTTLNTPLNAEKQIRQVTRSGKISRFDTPRYDNTPKEKCGTDIASAQMHPKQALANKKLRERRKETTQRLTPKLTAKELKDQAIRKALLAVAKQDSQPMNMARVATGGQRIERKKRMRFGLGRIVLALSCTAVAILALIYFINLNMPDIQFRAAAAQFNANYPGYVPYNYSPSEIISENNVTTIQFKNKVSDEAFLIIEEESSWDSGALLNNFVKPTYGENYTIVREQGLTIHISGSDAAWVNGGFIYKIEMKKGSLSKKQISDIATSF